MSEGESRLAAYIYACVKSVLDTINIPTAIILTPGKKIVFFIGLCMHVFRLCNYVRAYVRACVRACTYVCPWFMFVCFMHFSCILQIISGFNPCSDARTAHVIHVDILFTTVFLSALKKKKFACSLKTPGTTHTHTHTHSHTHTELDESSEGCCPFLPEPDNHFRVFSTFSHWQLRLPSGSQQSSPSLRSGNKL